MNLVDLFVRRTPEEEKRTFVRSRRSGRVTDQDKVLLRRPLTSVTSPTTDAFYAFYTGMQAIDGPLSVLRDKNNIESVLLQ